MRAEIELFESGWAGLSFRLRPDEIDQLISALRRIREAEVAHFHFRCDDFSGDPRIADVEFSLLGADEQENLVLE